MVIWLRKATTFSHSLRNNILFRRHSSEIYLFGRSYVSRPHFLFRRFKSNKLDPFYSTVDDDHDHKPQSKELDFPGGKVTYIPEMRFISQSYEKRVPCYRVLSDNGELIQDTDFDQVNDEVAVKMYRQMLTLQIMDTFFFEAQRQGRISFYITSIGEEAINIASAAAISPNDVVLAQYREPGVLLWRGFTVQEFASQCFSNKDDNGKGRQMPVHYGSNKLNYFTISSPLATQLPQAVGVAYSLKMDKKDACVVAYTGEGATSEGDFHAALNFAAVMEVPIVFICRNNGWAISTCTSEQFRSDGIVVKGQAYGIQSIRVDGNDVLAVYKTIREARKIAVNEKRPILVEAMTYRGGHHSTSDDSTKYRPKDEIEHWKVTRNPVNRYRKWIERNGWWSEKEESETRSSIRKEVMQAIQVAERTKKPELKEIFTDVYDNPPSNLDEQEKHLRETINRHPQDYPSDVPL
ncbi:2-oxoisovalerate dehydrogenase subunit alpha 2 mitochondrial [Euphorbia peplus]|nr:2-oxoisovalerate dehydrogenase subunit alpha 2 mitochondrial [Euphorbia peplus]